MNILFISHGLYPCKIGGVEIFNYFLIDALAQNNNNIYVITDCHEVKFSSANVRIVKVSPKRYFSKKLSTIINDSVNIIKLRKSIDVIHTPYMGNSWILGCYLPLIKRIFGIPYIVSIHGGGMHKWGPKFIRKFLFTKASSIIAGTESLKREYEYRWGKPVELIPPMIPFRTCKTDKHTLRRKYDYEMNDKIILCVGSIKRIKGNDLLLEAFFSLEDDFILKNRLKLCFVGDGPMRAELEKRVKDNDYCHFVKFHGNIPYEEVSAFYKIADIYVIASFYEGISKTLIEAMYNGLIVVGSDTVGVNDSITNGFNGFLFKLMDVKELRGVIKMVMECTEKELKKIRRNAKKFVDSKLSFQKTLTEFNNVYSKVKYERRK